MGRCAIGGSSANGVVMTPNEAIVAANRAFLLAKENTPSEYPERSRYICGQMKKRVSIVWLLEHKIISDFCSRLPLTMDSWEMKVLYSDLMKQSERERGIVSCLVDTRYNMTASYFVDRLYRAAMDNVKGRIDGIEALEKRRVRESTRRFVARFLDEHPELKGSKAFAQWSGDDSE